MPAKPKALMKTSKAKKKKEVVLNDADDYLAAGGDAEDAMGKHRGGDVPKALRFAERALSLYNEGLVKYPASFDLAYNRARLELEMATHPSFVGQLENVQSSLRAALTSHQFALKLDPDNADLLFNIAQVLTAIAEHVAEADDNNESSIPYLSEALEFQSRCLSIQEARYLDSRRLQQRWQRAPETQNLDDSNDEEDGGASLVGSDVQQEENEQWVTVVEPITANTLLDTILAQMGTLTTLCSVLKQETASVDVSSSTIEKLVDERVNQALPKLLESAQDSNEALSDRVAEISLTKANLASNFLDLGFSRYELEIDVYRKLLEGTFSVPELAASLELQIAYAKALITFNNSVAPRSSNANLLSTRWNVLTKAQKALTTAATLPAAKEDTASLASTHMLRGDISLLLFAMAIPQHAQDSAYEQAQSNAGQLLTNAEVFYRNSAKLYSSISNIDDSAQAQFRGAIVKELQSAAEGSSDNFDAFRFNESQLMGLSKQPFGTKSPQWVREQVEQLLDEGLVISVNS